MGWADALQGAGAWFSGQGPQWENAQTLQQNSLIELDEKRRQALLEDFRGTLLDLKSGNIEQASARLQDRLGAIQKLGGDPSHTAELNRMIQEGRVDEAVQGLQMIDDRAVAAGKLPSMADKHIGNKNGQDIFQRADGSTYAKPTEGWSAEIAAASGEGGADPANVREFQFWQGLSPEDQRRYLEVKRSQQMINLGGGAQGMVYGGQATPVTTQPGQTADQFREEYAAAEGDLQQVKEQSGQLGQDAGKVSTTAYEQYTNVRNGLKSYDKAIAAIDKGANSGKIASLFPTITAATVELENLRNKLGLDVVAASKFGALSEGELKLALEVAVPNLPPAELRKWMVDRKGAQEKLANYYKDVAIYLGKKGNTLPKYLEEMEAKFAGDAAGSGEMPTVPDAIDNARPKIRFIGFE